MIWILLVMGAVISFPLSSSDAAGEGCEKNIGFSEAGLECEMSRDEARSRMREAAQSPAPTHRYTVQRVCTATTEIQGPDCTPHPCSEEEDRHYHTLLESPIAANPPIWTPLGYVCLGSPEEVTQQLTVEDVVREFRRLTWPVATLNVQPAGGETLVNLPTVFHADNSDPVTQTITLLGQTVVIEAAPVAWTWHWARDGDDATLADTTPLTTDHPGAPHPVATITHAYRTSGITVRPSVDVTYEGRYRLNDGPWQDIPGTHTVAGPTEESLAVLEARPALVR